MQPTFSTAWLYVWNRGAAATPASITAVDKAGNTWYWRNPLNWQGQPSIEIPANNIELIPYGPLEFHCTQIGAVEALATGGLPATDADWPTIYQTAPADRGGDIYQTIDAGPFDIYQANSALVGKDLESDASLRARRLKSFGEAGATVINSLTANLLNIDGIGDKTRQKLFSHFETIDNIKNASKEELNKVVNKTLAEKIYNYYHK